MPQVTIFTRPSCGPCKTVKYFLNKRGISFTEKNVDEPDHLAEYARTGTSLQLPLIIVGDQTITGANIPLLSKLLMV